MEPIAIGGFKKALPNTILFLQSEINYTHIHFVDGTVLKVAYTLRRLEKRFKDFPKFFRCSRSYLVNMDYLASFKQDTFEVILTNGKTISISRRKRLNFMKTFKIKKIKKSLI
jgi:DNA-binding LytR/AlgR family response regulator